ncbi:uncharacterized protein METZ01_LOCUS108997 [marine metagenome]|uniref:Uncharacterized protein n=1 Tax=marine metagenome TaxID=408172 RepID=A0A381WW16_9ZZZZ
MTKMPYGPAVPILSSNSRFLHADYMQNTTSKTLLMWNDQL